MISGAAFRKVKRRHVGESTSENMNNPLSLSMGFLEFQDTGMSHDRRYKSPCQQEVSQGCSERYEEAL